MIRGDSWEDPVDITRFSYSRFETNEQPANSLLVTFNDPSTSTRTTLVFLGVKMHYFPLLTDWSDAQVIAQNRMNAQHEVSQPIEVFLKFCDDMQETLFWADAVQVV